MQQRVANDVIIQNYDYIMGCVNAILIFPYLVSSLQYANISKSDPALYMVYKNWHIYLIKGNNLISGLYMLMQICLHNCVTIYVGVHLEATACVTSRDIVTSYRLSANIA